MLRQGRPSFDVAVYQQDLGLRSPASTLTATRSLLESDSALAEHGYTYEYLSPAHLRLPAATVQDGRLFPEAGGMRAIVLTDQTTMAVDTARRLLELERSGLPVIFAGALPTATPGFHDAAGQDAELRRLIAELIKRPGAHRVTDLAAVPGLLAELEIKPTATPSTPSADVLSVRRTDPTTDYYFLFNQRSWATQQRLTLTGEGRPYQLDTWTGKITPLTDYRRTPHGVQVDVALEASDAAVIALSTRQDDTFRWSDADQPGPTEARNTGLGPVPLDDWLLRVESWSRGESGLPGDTAKTELPEVEPVADDHGALPPWSAITPANGYDVDLGDVSGVGTYSTTFTLDDGWDGVRAAQLELGAAVDTVTVTLNGTRLPVRSPQDLRHLDVGRELRPGVNTLTVRVASTLINAVRVAPGTGAADRPRQDYGLLGPVRLIPVDARQPTLRVEALDRELPLAAGGIQPGPGPDHQPVLRTRVGDAERDGRRGGRGDSGPADRTDPGPVVGVRARPAERPARVRLIRRHRRRGGGERGDRADLRHAPALRRPGAQRDRQPVPAGLGLELPVQESTVVPDRRIRGDALGVQRADAGPGTDVRVAGAHRRRPRSCRRGRRGRPDRPGPLGAAVVSGADVDGRQAVDDRANRHRRRTGDHVVHPDEGASRTAGDHRGLGTDLAGTQHPGGRVRRLPRRRLIMKTHRPHRVLSSSKDPGLASTGRRSILIALSAAIAMIASLLVVPAVAAGGLRLQAVSARPDLVTAGDVLITATVPRDHPLDGVRLTLEGTDVTGSFRADAATHTLTGFLDQLRPGTNRLIATVGALHDQLTMINHPPTGPVISGPHETPFICTTDRFTLVDGTTLGAPMDADCSIATRVDYAYRSTSGRTRPLPDPTVRPADLASTTTITGATVPFLIRIETGTLNRAIYQIAMLHDPATDVPTFDQRSPGWNDRLVYTFGGGCRRGWYTQGATTGGVLNPELLGRGYAVASASLNVFGNNCNDLLAAETMMMVKERFVEGYGDPLFTIGWGSSGGSYQSHQIADNYPGLLDGIVVGQSFPDVASATNFTLFDCPAARALLHRGCPGRLQRGGAAPGLRLRALAEHRQSQRRGKPAGPCRRIPRRAARRAAVPPGHQSRRRPRRRLRPHRQCLRP